MRDGPKEISNMLTGGHPMTKYLHTMIRVSSLEDTIAFFEVPGLREIRRRRERPLHQRVPRRPRRRGGCRGTHLQLGSRALHRRP